MHRAVSACSQGQKWCHSLDRHVRDEGDEFGSGLVHIDTAIAIRTMIVEPPGPDGRRRASVQAGAGVVADSVADDEELETRNKAKALLSAIPAAEAMTAQRRQR